MRSPRTAGQRRTPLAPLAAAALLAGCAMGPDYQRPAVDLPTSFGASAPAAGALAPDTLPLPRRDADDAGAPTGAASLVDTRWWQAFGDPQLDALIGVLLEENKELRIAAERVRQFEGALQTSRAEGMPRVGVEAGRSRNWLSENRQVPLAPGVDPVGNDYRVAIGASWELDLWGRIGRANEAAQAELLAVEENRRALVTSLVGQFASTYLQLLAVDREIELLRAIVDSRRESVRLLQAKFDGGRIPELPLASARIELEQLQAALPAKEREAQTLEHALAFLLGRNPGAIVRGRAFDRVALPPIPAGVPAQVLVQRPDVRQAEAELVAANARIGVAKAQYLPVVSLTAQQGFASSDLSRLTQLSSNFGTFGAALLGPLFDAGRIEGQVREAESRQRAAGIAYLRAVQRALREVEDALVWHRRMTQQAEARERQVGALAAQAELIRKREAGGAAELIEVLAAERSLDEGRIEQVQTRRDQLLALIAVYQSMGGGWGIADPAPGAAPASPTPVATKSQQ